MMAGDKKTAWGECSRHNHSVEYGHTNPCWRLGVPADCQGLCEGQLVCAPKVRILYPNLPLTKMSPLAKQRKIKGLFRRDCWHNSHKTKTFL